MSYNETLDNNIERLNRGKFRDHYTNEVRLNNNFIDNIIWFNYYLLILN